MGITQHKIKKEVSKKKQRIRVYLHRTAKIRVQQKQTTEIKMDAFKKVEDLSLDGNLSDNWRKFKQHYQIFEKATGLVDKPEDVRVAALLNTVGVEAIELFNTFTLSEEQRKKYQLVVNAFEDHCNPKKQEVFERYVFYTRNQCENEKFDMFLMDIKKLAGTCGFGDQKNSMVRDRIVLGTVDKKLQVKLLHEKDLSYEKAVEMARAVERTKEHAKEIQGEAAVVNNIKRNGMMAASNKKMWRNNSPGSSGNKSSQNYLSQKNSNFENDIQLSSQSNKKDNGISRVQRNCFRCNLQHEYNQCPAKGKQCYNCDKFNHFA